MSRECSTFELLKTFLSPKSKPKDFLESGHKHEYIKCVCKDLTIKEVYWILMSMNDIQLSGFYEPGSELWCYGYSGFSSPAQ